MTGQAITRAVMHLIEIEPSLIENSMSYDELVIIQFVLIAFCFGRFILECASSNRVAGFKSIDMCDILVMF